MALRQSLRTELESLAIDFAKSLLAALLSAQGADAREVLEGVRQAVRPRPQGRSQTPTEGTRHLKRPKRSAVEPEPEEAAQEDLLEEDVVIRDPEAMLNSLVRQRDGIVADAPRTTERAVPFPPDHVLPPTVAPTREPSAKPGEQILRTSGGGFVLRRQRASSGDGADLPRAETDA